MDQGPHRFRYSFVTGVIAPHVEDRVRDGLGAGIDDHGQLQVVTATGEGTRGYAAGIDLVVRLSELGVDVERTQPDLVDRRLIARRAGCTRQAVALWVNGQRHQGDPFPLPFNLTLGQTWLWGEVQAWLARRGIAVDDTIAIPTMRDHMRVDSHIAHRRAEYRALSARARAL
ncbi:hypothetical protein ACFWPA_00365 [Rhodococcus sp. NPDC058505]|uniref:hypothetical protein n=1 Tax=unclassified Rhodococcus (in: high G+C Gram-positive bacteria) TaxID=192944 RepID=UPI00364DD374